MNKFLNSTRNRVRLFIILINHAKGFKYKTIIGNYLLRNLLGRFFPSLKPKKEIFLKMDELKFYFAPGQSELSPYPEICHEKIYEKDDFVVIRAPQPIGKVVKIFEVSSPNTFTVIDATTEADIQSQNIPLYKLTNVRFTQPSDISTYTPVNGWEDRELIWVDKDANDKWSVLQNTRPWKSPGIKTTAAATAAARSGRRGCRGVRRATTRARS